MKRKLLFVLSVLFVGCSIVSNSQAKASSQANKANSQMIQIASGTGFYINRLGDFITNAHVVKNCKQINIGQKKNVNITAILKVIDKEKDIAVLRTKKIPNSVAPLRFDTRYNVGDNVIVIGYPGQAGISRNNIIKHAKIVKTKGFGNQPGWIQITNDVAKGNSGGPLLDKNGNVIGIVSGIMSKVLATGKVYEQVGMAISLPAFKKFLDSHFIQYSQRIYTELPFFNGQVEKNANKFIYNVHCIN